MAEAIRYALDHSPAVASSSSELSIRQLEEKNSFSRFFPSLDISTRAGLQDGTASVRDTPWVSQLDLTFSGTLYDNGETYTRNRIANLRRAEAELRLRMARDEVCREVAFTFLDFSLAEKLLQIKKDQYTVVQKQAQLVSAQYHQGLRTRKDFLRFKSELSGIELGLIESQATIDIAKSRLRAALGVVAPVEFAPTDASLWQSPRVEFVAITPEGLNLASVPERTPDLSLHYGRRLADFNIAKADKNLDLARRRYGPELTLSAGAGYGSADYIATSTPFVSPFVSNDQLTWNVLLNLRYNVWDWGIRRQEVAAAAEETKVQELTREAELLKLRSELEQLMLELSSLKKTYQFSLELLKMEKTSFELLETEYRNGRLSYLDLIKGVNDVSSAETTFVKTSFALQKKLIAYRYHEGTLHDEFCSR